MIKRCSSGKYRCFSRIIQQGLSFANLPLLGSCTSHSYCPEASDPCIKYVAERASCSYLFSQLLFCRLPFWWGEINSGLIGQFFRLVHRVAFQLFGRYEDRKISSSRCPFSSAYKISMCTAKFLKFRQKIPLFLLISEIRILIGRDIPILKYGENGKFSAFKPPISFKSF